jgi:hypothetical protein
VRYGARSLRNAPAFTAVAVLTLALGTGANTAVFSLVDGVLLVGLPYPAPHQLVSVTGTYPMGAFAAMRDEVRTLDVAAYADGQAFTMRGAGEPARLAGARVSAEFFAVLGVKPALGRWLRPGEDEANHDRYVVLSHATWETRFGRDTSIVGRFVELDGVPREVVGVMPPSFQFPSSMTQVWVPLGLDPGQTVRHWAGDFMPVIGRLRAGAARLQAHADVRLFQSRIAGRFPWRMPADWNRDVTVIPLHEALVGAMRPRLLILSVAVLLVLVTACANVANLTLSRAVSREREIGIRTAVGATPRTHRAAAAHRKRLAGRSGCGGRSPPRQPGTRHAETRDAIGHAAAARGASQLARARVYCRPGGDHRVCVRSGAGVEGHAYPSARHTRRRRAGWRPRSRRAGSRGPDRGSDRVRRAPRHCRGLAASQSLGPVADRSGLQD